MDWLKNNSLRVILAAMCISLVFRIGSVTANTPEDFIFLPIIGNIKILFIRVKYLGEPSGVISDVAAQKHANIIKNVFNRISYGQVSLTIDITPTLTMPRPNSYYRFNPTFVRLRSDAIELAKQAGFDVDSYDREAIFSEKIWIGVNAYGTINSRTIFLSEDLPYITMHELGHSFRWRHNNFWQVYSGSPISSNGTEIEYGDKFDMMGGSAGSPPFTESNYHHFNPWLKYRLGWIPQESILTVTGSGIYTIQALEDDPVAGTPVKYTSLRIRKDPLTDYWIFFRSTEQLVRNGPVIVQVFNNNTMPPRLLDMTPGSQINDWRDAALGVGQVFSDTQAGIDVKTLSVTSNEVRVDVTIAPTANLAAMDNLPTINVISPLSGETVKGVVEYETIAFDPDIGNTNGAGIARVKMYLHLKDDPLMMSLRNNQEPPNPFATAEIFAPPYTLQLNTASASQSGLRDDIYGLVVTATSVQGGTRTIFFPHIIDNAGPSLAAPVAVTLTPINPPIQIPATGGEFDFTVTLSNNSGSPQSTQVWNMITLPNGQKNGPTIGPVNVTLEAGQTINLTLTHNVPASEPGGQYNYSFKVGTFPDIIDDRHSFRFTKLSPSSDFDASVSEETHLPSSGDLDNSMTEDYAEVLPEGFALHQNHPNPFNPETIIRFQLPKESHVTLKIFNMLGQKIRTLVDSPYTAGFHSIRWDGMDNQGNQVASGIYLYQLQAGTVSQVRKMSLLR